MVCKKCEKKLTALAAPDKWKEGSNNTKTGTEGRKLNQNKLLSKSAKLRFSPYETKCKLCKTKVHQDKANYCQACAYKKGICAMCGKQVLDTSAYKQSSK
ncbi:cysteine-rich PDZ-binding protein-like protein [Radiomyces spectabilis]|uniref:cysteine-rich PDZ-binding protein-like protein n=1 Tax=Radiomyces spectabilis TaxID=64574 RepID=UPI0022203EB2|nr:cysteine-rich PDZ-binding protein-like protein [Radiomyces spectabilis]KAI8391389.1 cysteine-rich PDZ-binding protein-like protein [Radiomyces spectabilis]